MMSDFDSPWKEALEEYFEAFLAFFFAHAHRDIDWSRGYESLDKELQQVAPEGELRRRVVDKLIKVWRKSGDEEWVLVHIEVQSQAEDDFARRMYVYNYRLFDKYNRTVVSLAVLGDDRPAWRPDQFGYSLWGCTVRLQFPVVKLLDYAADTAELESSPNPFAALVLAHVKTLETRNDSTARRSWKVRLVKALYHKGWGREAIGRFFRFIDWMMILPREASELYWQEITELEKEQTVPYITTPERFGLERGLIEGIETVLKVRFGPAGLALMPEIQQLKDVDRLRAVLQAIPAAANVDDVRRVWA